MFDEHLSWVKQINLIVAKAYGKLRHAYRFKHFLSSQAKWRLSETYILSQFNYGDIVLQGLSNQLINKIQKVQNSCIRYSFGLRKYDHVSNTRKINKILRMQDRRLLHSLTLMFKITKNIAPIYLCNRVTYHSALHNYNTRHKHEIVTPFARSRARTFSFFINIAKIFNELSRAVKITDTSISTFRSKCISYLRESE